MKEEDIWTKTMRRYLNYQKSFSRSLWTDYDEAINNSLIKDVEIILKIMIKYGLTFGNLRIKINSLEELIIRLDLMGY